MLIDKEIIFSGVRGVGQLTLTLSRQKMNVLIGSNGVGKTKALECLYTVLLLHHTLMQNQHIYRQAFVFEQCQIGNGDTIHCPNGSYGYRIDSIITNPMEKHDFPVIYLAAQNRGEIKALEHQGIKPLGEYQERQNSYFKQILNAMENSFSTLNMNNNIEEWFIQRAQSANAYQAEADNREVELLTVLRILNKIDPRISADKRDFKIIGGKSVSIMLDGQARRLNELSSGFASLIKIVQSIVAGYGFFTNADEIENVQGYVLIDEIESHLHIQWQSKILPLLQQAFPNTYFIISTHSSLVLAQLHHGNAYQLVKNNERVFTQAIANPSQMALIDLLHDAFDVNLNQLKIDNANPESQQKAKNALLSLLGGEK